MQFSKLNLAAASYLIASAAVVKGLPVDTDAASQSVAVSTAANEIAADTLETGTLSAPNSAFSGAKFSPMHPRIGVPVYDSPLLNSVSQPSPSAITAASDDEGFSPEALVTESAAAVSTGSAAATHTVDASLASAVVSEIKASNPAVASSVIAQATENLNTLQPSQVAQLEQYFEAKEQEGTTDGSTDSVQNKGIFGSLFKIGSRILGKLIPDVAGNAASNYANNNNN